MYQGPVLFWVLKTFPLLSIPENAIIFTHYFSSLDSVTILEFLYYLMLSMILYYT